MGGDSPSCPVLASMTCTKLGGQTYCVLIWRAFVWLCVMGSRRAARETCVQCCHDTDTLLSCWTGNDGKVDESLAMMAEVEQLKRRRKQAEVA